MFNRKVNVVIILFIAFLVGCSNGPAHFTGYVMDVDAANNKLLVISGMSKEEVLNTDVVNFEVLNRLEDAYWLRSTSAKNFSKGDYVEVWFKGEIATSFPAQGDAKKIVKIEEVQ